jgi:two-component system response regulator FlrC
LVAGSPNKGRGRFSAPSLSFEKGEEMKARKILIVEDDISRRSALGNVLQIYGYETFSCESGEHALVKIREESSGVLITDFQMRGMDGLELIKEARKVHPGISTILVTGLTTEEIILRANGNEVNGFFPKPVERDELVSVLEVLKRQEKGEIGLGYTRFDTD